MSETDKTDQKIDSVTVKKSYYKAREQLREEREVALITHFRENKEFIKSTLDYYASASYTEMYYRFYHHSFKAYWVQSTTRDVRDFILNFHPYKGGKYNADFLRIVNAGVGVEFEEAHNKAWEESVLPLLTAAEHCRMLVRAMKSSMDRPADTVVKGTLDYDWGLVLYAYNMR